MGRDIHLYITKGKKIIEKEIFDGRNSRWFDNICGKGLDDEYNYFPNSYGIPADAPETIAMTYDRAKEDGYFDFYFMNVGKFKEWYEKYKPCLKAGWVNAYDKWRIEKKGYVPEDLPTWLSDDFREGDSYFVEYIDIYDCSKWLFDYLDDNYISDDATIIYYFDN